MAGLANVGDRPFPACDSWPRRPRRHPLIPMHLRAFLTARMRANWTLPGVHPRPGKPDRDPPLGGAALFACDTVATRAQRSSAQHRAAKSANQDNTLDKWPSRCAWFCSNNET